MSESAWPQIGCVREFSLVWFTEDDKKAIKANRGKQIFWVSSGFGISKEQEVGALLHQPARLPRPRPSRVYITSLAGDTGVRQNGRVAVVVVFFAATSR